MTLSPKNAKITHVSHEELTLTNFDLKGFILAMWNLQDPSFYNSHIRVNHVIKNKALIVYLKALWIDVNVGHTTSIIHYGYISLNPRIW
jgi:hypothetical protein